MKILCIIPSYLPAFEHGGPIVSVHNLNKSLVEKGVSVTVYTTNVSLEGKVPTGQEVVIDGVSVFYLKFLRIFEFFGPTGWQYSPQMKEMIEKNVKNFDLIYLSAIWNYPTLIGAHYCRKYKKPYVIAPRGVFYPYTFNKKIWKKLPYYYLISRRDMVRASAIHYTTQDEFEKCHSYLGLKNKAFIIPNGVDLSEFEKLPSPEILQEHYSELKGKKVILYLSRIDWKKGLDLLARAYSMIIRKRDDARLVIAGDGPESFKGQVREWFKKEGVLDKVVFTGMVTGERKLEVLVGSDLFVLPSHSESFGMAILEAMACGLPVVITDMVGIYNEVARAKAGLVVPCNAEQLAEAITKILDDPKLGEDFGDNGKWLVRGRFSYSQMTDDFIKECREIVNAYEKKS